MTIHIKHKFTSLKPDGPDPTVVRPTNWNDEHDISTAAGKLLGSDASGPITIQELPGSFATTGDFTLTAALGYFLGAKGTTGQRPGTPVSGMRRYNSTTDKEEYYDGADWQQSATEEFVDDAIAAIDTAQFFKGYMRGLTYNDVSASNIDVDAGTCVADDGSDFIAIAATTKAIGTAWAVDNGATPTGSLDTGAIANSAYFMFAIKNPTSGATAVLTSLSETAPTMPTGYTKKRLFGWFRRSGGSIVNFRTFEQSGGGIDFIWNVPSLDVAAVSVGTSRVTQALGSPLQVPAGFSVMAKLSLQLDFTGGDGKSVNVSSLYQDDGAVAFGSALLGTIGYVQSLSLTGGDQSIAANTGSVVWTQTVRTNTAGQIALRASGASATVSASVLGFEWGRR